MHEWCRRNPPRPRTTRSSRMWLHWVVVWCFSVPGKCGMLCGSPASSAGHWRCGLWLSSPLVREKKGEGLVITVEPKNDNLSSAVPRLCHCFDLEVSLFTHTRTCVSWTYTIIGITISNYICIFFSYRCVIIWSLPKTQKAANIDKFYFYLYMILGLDHDPRIASIRRKLLRL